MVFLTISGGGVVSSVIWGHFMILGILFSISAYVVVIDIVDSSAEYVCVDPALLLLVSSIIILFLSASMNVTAWDAFAFS